VTVARWQATQSLHQEAMSEFIFGHTKRANTPSHSTDTRVGHIVDGLEHHPTIFMRDQRPYMPSGSFTKQPNPLDLTGVGLECRAKEKRGR
jgi:hypothetical protein